MANYDLIYPGQTIDQLLTTAYYLKNAGYIFLGSASSYSGTPTQRAWLIAPSGFTGFGFSEAIPIGSMGLCLFNGTSWSGVTINVVTVDENMRSGSDNPISSGAVYDVLSTITQGISAQLDSLELADATDPSDILDVLTVALKMTRGGFDVVVSSLNILSATASKAGLMSAADKIKLDGFVNNIRSMVFADTTPPSDLGTKIVESLKWTVDNVQEVITTLTILAASTEKAGLMSADDKAYVDGLPTTLGNLTSSLQDMLASILSIVFADTTPTLDRADKIVETMKWTSGGIQRAITTLTLLAASTEKAGLMSADDKAYVDGLPATLTSLSNSISSIRTDLLNYYYSKTEVDTLLDGKQDVIDDLASIRSGAAAGSTAVQPAAIADFATTDYVGEAIEDAIAAIPVDEEPTAGSENLAKSGGIRMAMNPDIEMESGYYLSSSGEPTQTSSEHFAVTDYYFVMDGIKVVNYHGASAAAYTYLCFYDLDKKFISRLYSSEETVGTYTMTSAGIPSDAVYFRVSVDPTITGTRIEIPQNNIAYPIMGVVNGLLTGLEITAGYYLNTKGEVVETTADTFNVTDFMFATEGLGLINCHPTSAADNTYAVFYDSSKSAVGLLTASNTDRTTKVLQASDIPAGAVYVRATLYNDGRIENRKNYATVKTTEVVADTLSSYSTVQVGRTEMCFLTATGDVKSTSLTTFNVTDFCPIQEGIKVYKCHPASSAGKTFLCYYDANYDFISAVTDTHTTVDEYELTSSAIPEGAEYFRATVYADGYVDYLIPVSKLVKTVSNKAQTGSLSYFDYATALSMDKKELVCMIESASNGRVTALYDDEGYPSLMYKIPKVSVGAFSTALGNISTVHPAFIVNGVEKNYIYMSVFMTSVYNGHYVSWFGLKPKGQVTIPDLRTKISSKGEGWHLETIYERSLLALLTMKMNSATPTGNTKKGMSHVNFWEYCQMTDGILPGLGLPGGRTGIEWFNGTQPAAWSHNKELWGIQDVIGGYHEICDLMKLVNGKIYLASDNKYFSVNDDIETFESDWVDTGAAYDVVDNNLALSTQVVNPTPADTYLLKSYQNILCTSAYDSLSESIRKKMCLLLLSPRLTSSSDAIFPIAGRFGINNVKDLCYGVFGGAEEYEESGLGALIAGYPIDDNNEEGHNAHYNMGSRIVYIG